MFRFYVNERKASRRHFADFKLLLGVCTVRERVGGLDMDWFLFCFVFKTDEMLFYIQAPEQSISTMSLGTSTNW